MRLDTVTASRAAPPFSSAVEISNCSRASLSSITLSGFVAGRYLNALALSRSDGVVLTGFTVRNFTTSSASLEGSALAILQCTVNITGLTCSDSRSGGGPCLRVAAATVTVVNGSFAGNSGGAGAGGAVSLLGVEGPPAPSLLSILEAVFERNSAAAGGGERRAVPPQLGTLLVPKGMLWYACLPACLPVCLPVCLPAGSESLPDHLHFR